MIGDEAACAHTLCARPRLAMLMRLSLYAWSWYPGWSSARSAPKPMICPLSTSSRLCGMRRCGCSSGSCTSAVVWEAPSPAAPGQRSVVPLLHSRAY